MGSKPVNSVSAAVFFPILLASGSLWAQVSFRGQDFAVENGPESLVVGDFDGDGNLDLAVANTFSNDISVLLGNGDGTFQSAVSYPVGTNPSSIAVGSFVDPTKQDLVVANTNSNNISVLLGNGDGTFLPAVSIPAGNGPVFVAVGNFV
jgi:DNA-binding beta-propeller fold protein YncE